MTKPTAEMESAMYQALGAAEPGRHHAALRVGLTNVLALAEEPLRAEGYEKAIAILRGVAERTGSPAAKWAADYLVADPDKLRPGPCCDLHGRHCEPPSELCCERCTEASHVMFPHPHADGSRCVLAGGPVVTAERAAHQARHTPGETP